MPHEIERKFLVQSDAWRPDADGGRAIEQFYLAIADDRSVRVRIIDSEAARLTIKTGRGVKRGEFEYDIPLDDAEALRASAIGTVIRKRRHKAPLGEWTVEIDVFEGALAGLVYAEIELPDADAAVTLPPYIGREVTDDPAYTNAQLALNGRPHR